MVVVLMTNGATTSLSLSLHLRLLKNDCVLAEKLTQHYNAVGGCIFVLFFQLEIDKSFGSVDTSKRQNFLERWFEIMQPT